MKHPVYECTLKPRSSGLDETRIVWFGKILDKPNFTEMFWKLREMHLKQHYPTLALLYCYVIEVPY